MNTMKKITAASVLALALGGSVFAKTVIAVSTPVVQVAYENGENDNKTNQGRRKGYARQENCENRNYCDNRNETCERLRNNDNCGNRRGYCDNEWNRCSEETPRR